jgi:Neprosin
MTLAAIALAGFLAAGLQPGTSAGMQVSASHSTDVKFSWVGAYYVARTHGASAVLPQADPKLDPPGIGHSLAEIAVQAAGQQQVVEVGWTVDSAEGDLLPHLFVFAWVNGQGLGYDCCGYVQTGHGWAPGDHVKPGISARYGIRQQGGRWWISYQGSRIGYYPDSLWHGRFVHALVSQAFGEVASNGPTGTQMIDGRTDREIRSFRLLGTRTPAATFYAPKSRTGYRMGRHGRHWFYLGGH